MNATKLRRTSARLKQNSIYNNASPRTRLKKQLFAKTKRISRKLKAEDKMLLKGVKSKGSVIYVGTIFPYKTLPNAESVIDLTMSETNLSDNRKLEKFRDSRHNSIETIQPVRNFEADSCGDFGLLQNNLEVNTYYKHAENCKSSTVCVRDVNSNESTFLLKRTSPFTSIDECSERPHLNADEKLLADLENKITKEIDNLEMNGAEKTIYQLDVTTLMQLYNVDPDDGFNNN